MCRYRGSVYSNNPRMAIECAEMSSGQATITSLTTSWEINSLLDLATTDAVGNPSRVWQFNRGWFAVDHGAIAYARLTPNRIRR